MKKLMISLVVALFAVAGVSAQKFALVDMDYIRCLSAGKGR